MRKREQLSGPRFVGFHRTLGQALDRDGDDPRLVGVADELAAYLAQATDELGETYGDDADIEPRIAQLMDALAFDTASPARRLIELSRERGWKRASSHLLGWPTAGTHALGGLVGRSSRAFRVAWLHTFTVIASGWRGRAAGCRGLAGGSLSPGRAAREHRSSGAD